MATVHPSRQAHIPASTHDRNDDYRGSRHDTSHRRSRSPTSRENGHNRSRDEYAGDRRRSPDYAEYRRPPPPDDANGAAGAPWRQPPRDMYAGRGGRNGYESGGGNDFMDRYHIVPDIA